MGDFFYRAANKSGTLVEGTLSAATQELAFRELRSRGLVPVSVSDALSLSSQGGQSLHVRRRDRADWRDVLSITNELAVLLRAGLPVDRALKVLIDMSAKEGSRQLLQGVLSNVKAGKPLSVALAEHQRLFGGFYINMVRSGEASGRTAEVLAGLAEHLERSKAVRSSVVSALIYPAILLVVALLSVVMMLGFVVPQFEDLFSDLGDALPVLTKAVISAGDAIQAYGWMVAMILIPSLLLLRRWYASPAGKQWLDQRLLAMPLLGQILFKYEIARFSRTLGTLLHNGVSLLQSLAIASDTVGNSRIKASLDVLRPATKQGRRMSQVLAEAKTFSPMMVQMVRVGEESGRLDEMMLELAKVYDDEVQAGIKRGLTLLEPLLILTMGGMIALIIVSILMGILSVNELVM